jgi:hypothetical protein
MFERSAVKPRVIILNGDAKAKNPTWVTWAIAA